MSAPTIPEGTEVKTYLIWDSPEAELAYRALTEMRARRIDTLLDAGPSTAEGLRLLKDDPASEEIARVLTRLLIDHSRPGMLVTMPENENG